jgi:hypothetical protein
MSNNNNEKNIFITGGLTGGPVIENNEVMVLLCFNCEKEKKNLGEKCSGCGSEASIRKLVQKNK